MNKPTKEEMMLVINALIDQAHGVRKFRNHTDFDLIIEALEAAGHKDNVRNDMIANVVTDAIIAEELKNKRR